jgi:hypothetical protein
LRQDSENYQLLAIAPPVYLFDTPFTDARSEAKGKRYRKSGQVEQQSIENPPKRTEELAPPPHDERRINCQRKLKIRIDWEVQSQPMVP